MLKIKLRWAIFVTYTIIQSITSREMCSLHLTHPSAHTLGAVGSRHCGARGAVGGSVPCSRVSPQSWTIPARAEIRTHNIGSNALSIRLATTAPVEIHCWYQVFICLFCLVLLACVEKNYCKSKFEISKFKWWKVLIKTALCLKDLLYRKKHIKPLIVINIYIFFALCISVLWQSIWCLKEKIYNFKSSCLTPDTSTWFFVLNCDYKAIQSYEGKKYFCCCFCLRL